MGIDQNSETANGAPTRFRWFAAIALVLLLAPSLKLLFFNRAVNPQKALPNRHEAVLSGKVRPRLIPLEWKGEPLPLGKGWRWFNPKDRSDSVRIYRGDPTAENPVDRDTYVVVTDKGELIGANGKHTGKFLFD